MTTYVGQLDATEPKGTSQRTTIGTEIRALKQALVDTFPNLTDELEVTHTELDYMDAVPHSLTNHQTLAATSSGATYQIAPSPALTSLSVGMRFTFQADADNTLPTKLQVNSITAVAINNHLGDAVEASYIPEDAVVEVIYLTGEFRILKL